MKKQGGTFILGKAVQVDPKGKKRILESGYVKKIKTLWHRLKSIF